MPESDRPAVSVHFLPALIAPAALAGGVAVVVDVLRATTVMVQALASGCEAIVPCLEIGEARARASEFPPGDAILAGERQGLPIEGFDLGNSPGAFTPEVCRGKTLVMTTTNGTRAILACLEAERVVVAAFSNLRATVDALEADGRPVHVVCSGTDGRISFEDTLLAGELVRRLTQNTKVVPANDEAEIAAGLAGEVFSEVADGTSLSTILGRGRGGRRVRALELFADIVEAARVDRFRIVGELRREPLRIVRRDS